MLVSSAHDSFGMRLALFSLVLAFVAGCGSAPPLYATEAPAETVVDGSAAEWPSALRPVPSESGLSIGVRAEGDDLYVVLIAGDDRQARRIALGGVRVWVDPMGGNDPVLGVRYPAPEEPTRGEIAQGEPRRGGPRDDDPTRLRRRFEAGLDVAEITRGVVTQRVSPEGGADIKAAAMWGPRSLVIEMMIPLDARDGLLEQAAGREIGVGVELLDVQRPQVQPPGGRGAARDRGPDGEIRPRAHVRRLDADALATDRPRGVRFALEVATPAKRHSSSRTCGLCPRGRYRHSTRLTVSPSDRSHTAPSSDVSTTRAPVAAHRPRGSSFGRP